MWSESFIEQLQGSAFKVGVELVSTRGTLSEQRAKKSRAFAQELIGCDKVDWVSITDNAGGYPMISPTALAIPLLYAGKNVVIHLSCKDLNRHGLESQLWNLASEGFHNILAISGDYPVHSEGGMAKPVFDLDSLSLLNLIQQMNSGLEVKKSSRKKLLGTQFLPGAVVNPFKTHEEELIPQMMKLEKKIHAGASYIIPQVGFDARRMQELSLLFKVKGWQHIPVFGNVFVLSPFVVKLFQSGHVPGVTLTPELAELCLKYEGAPSNFFVELAAKQMAIYRGLGYSGVYLGGVHDANEIEAILAIERSFAADDWKDFVPQFSSDPTGQDFLFAADPDTGLSKMVVNADASHCEDRLSTKEKIHHGFASFVHGLAFDEKTATTRVLKAIGSHSKNQQQGPTWLRAIEKISKKCLFNCKDCGDCSLQEVSYLCPESQCAKNQRNGPCGGSHAMQCEVLDKDCIWARAYRRNKAIGNEKSLLRHAPVVQDQGLRETSAWMNHWQNRDHTAQKNPNDLEDWQLKVDVAPPARMEPEKVLHHFENSPIVKEEEKI